MNEIEFWTVVVLLVLLNIVQGIIHKQERKDLYNRIMARDLPEYKAERKVKTVPNGIKKRIEENRKKQNSPE